MTFIPAPLRILPLGGLLPILLSKEIPCRYSRNDEQSPLLLPTFSLGDEALFFLVLYINSFLVTLNIDKPLKKITPSVETLGGISLLLPTPTPLSY